MNIRKNIIILLVGLMPLSSAFAFVGFGLHLGQNQLAISNFSKSMTTTSFTRGGFDNTFAVGGYFYIDAIPFIDLDVEFQASGKIINWHSVNRFQGKALIVILAGQVLRLT